MNPVPLFLIILTLPLLLGGVSGAPNHQPPTLVHCVVVRFLPYSSLASRNHVDPNPKNETQKHSFACHQKVTNN